MQTTIQVLRFVSQLFLDGYRLMFFRSLESISLPFNLACMYVYAPFLDPANSISVPPNVRFIIDDIEEEWQYSSKFDYIHSRMMNSSVADWESYATKIFEYGSS